jgi:transposase
MMTRQTREKWAERVREWRASGVTAEAFAEGKEYQASSLRWADSQLKGPQTSKPAGQRRTGDTSTAGKGTRAPRFLPVRLATPRMAAPDVVVEVGGARIRVGRGADLALVGDVVRALQGGVR